MKSFIAIACLFTAAYACSPTPPVIAIWTRTWEPVLNFILKSWPNIDDSYGTYKCQYIPYARHYKPRLVYFFIPFLMTIYVLWPLAICMACIQERLLIKSGIWWRAYVICICSSLSLERKLNNDLFSWFSSFKVCFLHMI